MQPERRKIKGFWPLAATAALLLVLMASPAQAVIVTHWVGSFFSTSWNNPHNWDNHVPQTNYVAVLESTTNKTVTFDNPVNYLLYQLIVSSTGSATFTLKQNGYALSSQVEYIGYKVGKGAYIQNGGSNTVTNTLYLGYASGTRGTYDLTGGSLYVDGREYLGDGGTGNFTQSKGSHTVTDALFLGKNLGSRGDYTLKGGSLSANTEVIGVNGSGSFTQSGGTNSAGSIELARDHGSVGTYNLNSGTVSAGGIKINGPGNPASGTGTFNVHGKATVNGNVQNDGTVNTTNSKVTWNGHFQNNNVYTSTTSTQAFVQDLAVAPSGYLVANISSVFSFQGNFDNESTQNTLWNTDNAQMQFVGPSGTIHSLFIPGLDVGLTPTADNFNWYSLNIAGQIVYLQDGNGTSGGAQYVRVLTGAVLSGNVVTNIFGNTVSTLNIYYDPDLAANFYLHGLTYDFANGPGHGQLIADGPITPTPLPPSALLLGSGLLGLGLLGWRRKRLKS